MADDTNANANAGANANSDGGNNNANNNANGGGALHRPEHIPEQFWDGTKGAVKTDDLVKGYTTLQAEVTTLKGKQVQVPEKYDLKLPEGAVVKPETIERTATVAKKLGLPQDGANEVLAFANGEVKAFQEGQAAEHAARVDKWLADSKADPDIAGEKGDQFDANTELARKAFKHFGGDALVDELNKTGFGNHPVLVKTFMKIGKAMAPDKLEGGQHGGGQGQKSAADVLYGTPST